MADETILPGPDLSLNEKQASELKLEISSIVDEHRADTAEFMRNLVIQRRLYELKSRRKTWPWPGAANFIVPMVRYVVDHYKGRIQQAFRQSSSVWHGAVHGVNETDAEGRNWRQIADDAAHVLDYLCKDPSHVDLYTFIDDSTDATAKDGTCLVKVHYVSDMKRRPAASSKGGRIKGEEVPFRERVAWDVLEISRCVWTVGCTEPDEMPVVGHWMEFTRGKLRTLAHKHKIPKDRIEAVLKSPDNPWYVDEERILDEEMGITREASSVSRTLSVYRIYELSVEYQLNDDDPPILMTVWWHQGSQTLLRVFDPSDYAKPYETDRFLKRGRQFLGSGIAEALRVLNLGANAVVNQTTDAQTIANAFGFLYKADSLAAAFIANSGIFPGVKIPVTDDVNTEFKSFQLGTGSVQSGVNLLAFFLQLAEMIGKVGPSQLGNVSAGSRTAASVGLGIMQEGNQMIDSVITRKKDMINRAGVRTLVLYAHHDPNVFDEALPPERASELLKVISDPAANFLGRVRLDLRVASAASNREKDKQDLIVVTNFMINLLNQVAEKLPLLANPQVPPPAKQTIALLYAAIHECTKRLLAQFEQFKDPEGVLSADILVLMEQMAQAPPPMPMGAPGQPGAPAGGPQLFPNPAGGAQAPAPPGVAG